MICEIRLLKVCFHRELEFGNYFFDHLEPNFLANFYACNGKQLFRLVEKNLLSIGASLESEGGSYLTHGNT